MNARFERRVQIGLGVACLVLATTLFWEAYAFLASTTRVPERSVVAAPSSEPPAKAMGSVELIANNRDLMERPLFNPSRRPFPEGSHSEVSTATGGAQRRPATGAMVLAGIALSSGRQVAVIEMPGVKGLSRAALGDEVGGWTVVRIEPEAISLKKGNEIKELVLMVRRSPAQPPKAEPNKAESNTEEVDAAEPAEDTEADTPEPSE